MTETSKKLTWLHLSDLHIGQQGQWLWPNFKSIFIDDLLHLTKETGAIDLVIFSGDLTQKAEQSEFAQLTLELSWIWEELNNIGQCPLLFVVPGNHDLQRPAGNDARVKLMKQWNEDLEIAKEFWSTTDNQYLDVVGKAFANYSAWCKQLVAKGIPLANEIYGKVPGDCSASLSVNGITVGLVGLNTAYLQLGGEDYQGKLALDVRQLNAVTENDPPKWCAKHEINLLITHHPSSWLSDSSLHHFHAEIYPSDRFTAHLFGHMHDAEVVTTYKGGDGGRRLYQSASLFGLELLGDGSVERAHGYSIGCISLSDKEGQWKLWPRKGIVNRSSGDRRIIPDHDNFHLERGKEYLVDSLHKKSKTVPTSFVPVAQAVDLAAKVEETNPLWTEALMSTMYSLNEQVQHVGVRLIQQQACIESIRQKKMMWVCADWELGRDGFLWSVIKRTGRDSQRVYRIDLENYSSREELLERFGSLVGCSFTEYCKALSNAGPAILVLDEAPVTIGEVNGTPIEKDAEELALMIKDFCPEIIVIMLARTVPKIHKVDVVKLEPLDEVDTRIYLLAHSGANEEVRSTRAVNEIFRHTEGFPAKIDRALKTLRVVSLAELGPPSAGEIISGGASNEIIPMSLVTAVGELAESNDPDMKRSYLLLTALSILPHGETLQRLKRIRKETPVFPKHAVELLDRDLIQVRKSSGLIHTDSGDESHTKLLAAPRSVRDYVLTRMSKSEIEDLVYRATSLYFGDTWQTGSATLKRLNGYLTSGDGNLLQNPQFLIGRFLASTNTWASSHLARLVLQLCTIYCAALLEGKYYRHTVAVCRDFLTMIPDTGYDQDRDTIEVILAKSLRMVGQHDDAKELYTRLLEVNRPKKIKVSLLSSYALCLQSLNDEEATKIATQVVKMAPKSGHAAQAQAIILEMQADVNNDEKLVQLEKHTRKRGFNTVANNLILDRATRSKKDEDLLNSLQHVYTTAMADDDQYTAARAIVKLVDLSLQRGVSVSNENLNRLINAYQYCYGERFNNLFANATKSLWTIFDEGNDIRNMLSLFRHSSFIWRLQNNEVLEENYAQRLINSARHILNADVLTADQNTAYFLLRARDIDNI